MFTQNDKPFSIDTPLGMDVLLLARFTGYESISENFHFDIDLYSEQYTIPFEDIIGKNVTLNLYLSNGEKRFFNGLISSFSRVEGSARHGFSHYAATMVPWSWLLTRTTDSRIFQNLTIPDIVEKVFKDHGFVNYKFNLAAGYEPREYTVQYRESDYNFICRLLEEVGIHFFFEHEAGKHTMILADHSGANLPCPNRPSVQFKLSGENNFDQEDKIDSLAMVKKIQAGKYSLRDYNYETPDASMEASADTVQPLGPGEREKYDYPGIYKQRNAGDNVSVLRMEEEESRISTISGTSECRDFTTGFRFRLLDSLQEEWNNKEYLLTRITHKADQAATYFSGKSELEVERDYTNSFTCVAHDIPYRPPLRTKIPVVEGVQTAITVGPAGEEIYTDGFGRVKVQFHWDREGKNDEHSSCWLRVSQSMAGPGWGALFLPRIGHEVIVEFIEGNPDRPIVTGQVYHGTNRPPYNLPAEKTKSTFKSNSSPGGGGFNEFRLEDKKGSEEIFLHGQKDWNINILNNKGQTIGVNETMSVGNNRTKSVGNDQSESIGNNKSITVGTNHTEKIGSNMTLTVATNRTATIGSNLTQTVGSNKSESIGGSQSLTVSKNKTETVAIASAETVGAAKALTVGAALQTTVGGAMNTTVGLSQSEQVIMSKSANIGKKFSIEVGDSFEIVCGKTKFIMKKNGDITLEGVKVDIVGSDRINLN